MSIGGRPFLVLSPSQRCLPHHMRNFGVREIAMSSGETLAVLDGPARLEVVDAPLLESVLEVSGLQD